MSVYGISDTPNWYVVRTCPKQEERAVNNLNAWQVETFLPKMKVNRVNPFTGISGSAVVPMFPLYSFAKFDASRMLHKVCHTRGVHSVVSFGGVPAPVNDEIIELIRERIGADGLVQFEDDLKVGDRVKVTQGPLANFSGVFDRNFDGHTRVAILLTSVTYQGRLVVDREHLEKVKSSAA